MKLTAFNELYPFIVATGSGGTSVGGSAPVSAKDQWKQPVRAATTANIDVEVDLEEGATIDGRTLATGDRVLVKDQTAAAENGIYVVGEGRAPDMDESDEVVGSVIFVIDGTANGGTVWRATNTTEPVIDTDAIAFVLFFGNTFDVPIDHGSMGSSETLDFSAGTTHRGTLDADCAITVTGFTVDEALYGTVKVTQDGTGGHAITWDADVQFSGDDQPAQAAGSVTWFAIWSEAGDSEIYGAKVGSGSALEVLDEGVSLDTAVGSINFTGDGVSATNVGHAVTANIPGTPTGAAGGDLSGTYPNPSVVDDSHSHTAATLPAAGSTEGAHVHVAYETHTSDGSATTFTLDQFYEPGSVMAWNRTSGALLGVTEVLPDQATVSAAGTAADLIDFHYAASVV